MAQISFDVASQMEADRAQNSNNNSFDFFTLRNDGDEAIVRFAYNDTSTFKIYTVHDVELETGGQRKNRKVSCLRNPHDPINMCPLCSSGRSSRNMFLIEMIQYVTDPQTNAIVPKPFVWERSMSYAARLKSLLDEYGPLTDCIFKIKRCGAAGSRDTTYEIYYGSPKMYPDEIYVKDFSGLSDLNFLGTVVLDKNYDEIDYYLNTGRFPQSTTTNNESNTATSNNTAYNTQASSVPPAPTQYVPKAEPVNSPGQQPPHSSNINTPPPREQYVPNTAPNANMPVRQYDAPVGGPPLRVIRYY